MNLIRSDDPRGQDCRDIDQRGQADRDQDHGPDSESRNIPILSDLPEEGLRWLADHAKEFDFQPGEIMIKEGGPADAMIVYLEGESDARRESLGPDSPVLQRGPELARHAALLADDQLHDYQPHGNQNPRGAHPEGTFPEMLNRIPALGPRLVGSFRIVCARPRNRIWRARNWLRWASFRRGWRTN